MLHCYDRAFELASAAPRKQAAVGSLLQIHDGKCAGLRSIGRFQVRPEGARKRVSADMMRSVGGQGGGLATAAVFASRPQVACALLFGTLQEAVAACQRAVALQVSRCLTCPFHIRHDDHSVVSFVVSALM